MLFTCLFLMPHANYALNYTNWRSPWDRCVYSWFRSRCVLADIGTINSKINRKLCKFKHVFHFGRYYQLSIELKWKLDGKSIANFVNKNTIFPHNFPLYVVYLFILAAARQLHIELYTCSSCWQVLFRNGAAQAVFHSTRRNVIPTSGFAPIVFWQIWALETIVNNLKSIANFGNLNVFFLYQWNLLGGRLLVKCVLGWIGGGRISPIIIW